MVADTAPRRGRPPGSARPGHLVTLKLSLEARRLLDHIPRPERGRWVSGLIEAAVPVHPARDPDCCCDTRWEPACLVHGDTHHYE